MPENGTVKDVLTPENTLEEAVEDSKGYLAGLGSHGVCAATEMKQSGRREGFGDALAHVKAGLAGQATVTTERGKTHFAGQSTGGIINTVLAIGITGVIAVVLTVVMDQTQQSVDVQNQNLSDANSNVVGGYGDAMGLLGVVFLVLLLSVVVAALFGLVPGQ